MFHGHRVIVTNDCGTPGACSVDDFFRLPTLSNLALWLSTTHTSRSSQVAYIVVDTGLIGSTRSWGNEYQRPAL